MLDALKGVARDWLLSGEDGQSLGQLALEYPYTDLYKATSGFAQTNRLGAGAAGAVYRGELRGGTQVAVKVLAETANDLFGFEDEVRVLSRFRHPNLVTLLGWGSHAKEKYLIYELLDGGDVQHRLSKAREGRLPFLWHERLRVALDAACGLSHMVNSTPKAFHRDIKTANILLDANGSAKMADFGLAGTIHAAGRQHLSVAEISGTPGYCCPHYIQTGRVTEQTEIYSYGMVLLELLLNQPPALCGPMGDIIYPLLQTVQPASPGAHNRVIVGLDTTAGTWAPFALDHAIELALGCVDRALDRRPTFESAVVSLRNVLSSWRAETASGAPLRQMNNSPAPLVPLGMNGPDGGGLSGHRGYLGCGISPGIGAGCAGGSGGPRQQLDARTLPPEQHNLQANAPRSISQTPNAPAEILLDCLHAEGIDLATVELALRCLVFPIGSLSSLEAGGRQSWRVTIGRQHQPDFFERLVLSRDHLSVISRSHFEIIVDGSGSTGVRKLSANALLLADWPMPSNDIVPVESGTRLAFVSLTDPNHKFLVLNLRFRSHADISRDGPYHTSAPQGQAAPRKSVQLEAQAVADGAAPNHLLRGPTVPLDDSTSVPAVLECIRAAGLDVEALTTESRALPFYSFDKPLELGRQHQLGFFENLLKVEPKWLNFISRTHCRVRLSGTLDQLSLKVENLSSNVIFVSRKPLAKGHGEVTLPVGSSLGFVAVGKEGEEPTIFLEFRLRRATSIARSSPSYTPSSSPPRRY